MDKWAFPALGAVCTPPFRVYGTKDEQILGNYSHDKGVPIGHGPFSRVRPPKFAQKTPLFSPLLGGGGGPPFFTFFQKKSEKK